MKSYIQPYLKKYIKLQNYDARRPSTIKNILSKKDLKIEKVIIYLPGKTWIVNGIKDYTDICQGLVKELDILVIALDYTQDWYHKTVEICKNTVEYLIHGLNRVGIEKEAITLMGDSTGASLLASITQLEKEPLSKQILLYPALKSNI